MSSREKKKWTKKKTTKQQWVVKQSPVLPPPPTPTPTESITIPSFPDDLLVSCFARVSRLYYPVLSLVSKRYRSILASPELYKTRSILGRKESCLYMCLRFPHEPNPRWLTLVRKPNQTLTNDDTMKKKNKKKKSSSGYVFAPISIPNSPSHINQEGLVAVGSSIYAIGGDSPSAKVSVLDCKSHTWHEAPSMNVKRKCPAVNVVDGKIYVAGGCNSSNWMEIFDIKTEKWETVLCPHAKRFGNRIRRSVVSEGEIYMFGNNIDLVYKTKEDKWEVVRDHNLHLGWSGITYCTIDNVLYGYSRTCGINWYDEKIKDWIELEGLRGLPEECGLCRVIEFGGKLVFWWEELLTCSKSKRHEKKTPIWCAVIALERRNGGEEIWGNVEWLDEVFTVPISCEFVSALAPTL